MPFQPTFPDDGAYALRPDLEQPWTASFWLVRNGKLESWPIGTAKYGPPRPPILPGTTPAARREQLRFWKARVQDYRDQVVLAIATDPVGTASEFTALTGRCHHCRGFFNVEQLQLAAVLAPDAQGEGLEEPG